VKLPPTRLRRSLSAWIVSALLAAPAIAEVSSHPRDREIHDADTLAWWHTTEALSSDTMEGRDTGSPAYQRAADYVAGRFNQAGLLPAGENDGYFQAVLMHELAADPKGTDFMLVRPNGSIAELKFLEQITLAPAPDMPTQLEAPLTFRGYCGKEALGDVAGKIVLCFGTQRAGLPSGAARAGNVRAAGALAIINVDDPYFSIEPPRWPYAYARAVTLHSAVPAAKEYSAPFASLRVSAAAFGAFLVGTGQDAAALLKKGGAKQPLPGFEIPSRFKLHIRTTEKFISSPNVLATLPGTNPALGKEYVVVSAHLDGYGYGTPVNGDNLYNGTLDDAAYIALIIQLAEDIKSGKLPKPARSLLFAAFTGEEKGLLGSYWYVDHPTVPLAQLAANVNLDQLRPLFPLDLLTAEALDDTSLGDTARAVAAPMKIEIRADAEPERNLLHRADQYPFLTKHVPAISFIFGYDPSSEAEQRYREWYHSRYHRPQDDLTQPVDFAAAAKFNEFFYKLVAAICNEEARPAILPKSPFAAKN
jgi:Zn-dependent M28 family amino/carboxypeptidase